MTEQLSPHFTLDELQRSRTAERLGIDNAPPPAARANLDRLARLLEEVRAALGGRAIHITSGYRSPELNRRVGGSPASAHMDGCAADLIVWGMSPLDVARVIDASAIAFDQLIYEGDWVHIAIPTSGRARRNRLTAWFRDGRRYVSGIQGIPA